MENKPLNFKDFSKVQTIKKPNGEFEYRFSLKALTPRGKWLTDKTSLYAGIITFAISGVYTTMQVLDEIVPVASLGLAPVLGGLAWGGSYWFLKSLLSTGSTIAIDAGELKIHKWYYLWHWHRINRNHGYSIIKRPDPSAKREKAKQELKEKKAKFADKKFTPTALIHDDAYVVEVNWNGQTCRLLSSHNNEIARQAHAFLVFMDGRIAKEGQSSGAIVHEAKEQWKKSAGGLDD